jgi:DNA-directed RNA polymerase subunit RPC12/RpoP
MYRCNFCGEEKADRQDLILHLNSKHPFKKGYQCFKCGRNFPKKYDLYEHIRTEHWRDWRDNHD